MRQPEDQRRAFARGFRAGRRLRAKDMRELADWLEAELHGLREEMLQTAGAHERLQVLQAGWPDVDDPVLH